MHESPTLANVDDMKKKTVESENDLRPHYDFDYSKMKPNRFANEPKIYKKALITLDEDVSVVFQSSEEVNTILRSAIKAIRTAAPTKVSAKTVRPKRRAS